MVLIRPLSAEDSMEELTGLLHRAYGALAAVGFNYTASYQDANETRLRASVGECYVAELDGCVVGTIIFRPAEVSTGCAYYDRAEVAHFAQFAVDPVFQRSGVGSRLLEFVERRAREVNTVELAFDTAEGATELRDWYGRRGYAHVDYTQWPGKSYRSVVMSKVLIAES